MAKHNKNGFRYMYIICCCNAIAIDIATLDYSSVSFYVTVPV